MLKVYHNYKQNRWTDGWLVGWLGFNVGLDQRSGLLPNSLGLIPRDDQETCHHNFDPHGGDGSPTLVPPEADVQVEEIIMK